MAQYRYYARGSFDGFRKLPVEMALVLEELTCIHVTAGRPEAAELLHRREIAIYEMLVSVDHPSVAVSLGALANVYQATGRDDEANAAPGTRGAGPGDQVVSALTVRKTPHQLSLVLASP